MRRALTAREAACLFKEKGIRFVSGKWFSPKGDEIKRIDQYILLSSLGELFPNTDRLNDAKDYFIAMYGEDVAWPPLPIVEEARNWEGWKPLPLPLTDAQLMLVRKLIQGDEEYIYILCGIGGSGKSTFANVITRIFENDVASLTLSDLCDDFKLAEGVSSRLIYSDELDSDAISSSKIKTLASKQRIMVNGKNQRPYSMRFQGNILFSCNKPPKLDISDSGMLRRICYLSMNKKIENPDKTLQKREWSKEDLVMVVRKAMMLDDTDWFEKYFAKDTHEILMQNNSVALTGARDYQVYRSKCIEMGLKPYSQPNWEAIKDVFESWGWKPDILNALDRLNETRRKLGKPPIDEEDI